MSATATSATDTEEATSTGLLHELHRDLERRERIEAHFTRRLRWGLSLVGFVAALIGGLMFWLIYQMNANMATMSSQIQQMTRSVSAMNTTIDTIGQDTHRMVGSISDMQHTMSGMGRDIASLPPMQQNVARMSGDVGALRSEVGGISHDTRVMRGPFRAMDRMLP